MRGCAQKTTQGASLKKVRISTSKSNRLGKSLTIWITDDRKWQTSEGDIDHRKDAF